MSGSPINFFLLHGNVDTFCIIYLLVEPSIDRGWSTKTIVFTMALPRRQNMVFKLFCFLSKGGVGLKDWSITTKFPPFKTLEKTLNENCFTATNVEPL